MSFSAWTQRHTSVLELESYPIPRRQPSPPHTRARRPPEHSPFVARQRRSSPPCVWKHWTPHPVSRTRRLGARRCAAAHLVVSSLSLYNKAGAKSCHPRPRAAVSSQHAREDSEPPTGVSTSRTPDLTRGAGRTIGVYSSISGKIGDDLKCT